MNLFILRNYLTIIGLTLCSSFIFAQEPVEQNNGAFVQDASPSKVMLVEEEKFNQLQWDFLNQLDESKIEQTETYQAISTHWKAINKRLRELIDNPYHQKYSDDSLIPVWQKQVAIKFNLLREMSFAREKAIQAARRQERRIIHLNEETIGIIIMEIQLIPYRVKAYGYSKLFSFEKNFSSGFEGIINLLREIMILLFVFLIPFLSVKLSKTIVRKQEEQRRKSFYLSFKSKFHRYLAFGLSFFIPLTPYIIALFTLFLVRLSISTSDISEVSELLIYIEYYVYYKIFRIFIEYSLKYFVENVKIQNKKEITKKIKSTSLILSSFFLVLFSIKHAFRSILGDSLVFSILETVLFWVILILLSVLFSRWSNEVKNYLGTAGIESLKKLTIFLDGKWKYFFSLPAMVIALLHFVGTFLINWSTRFDFIKSIYAKILRIRIETKDADPAKQVGAPLEYKKQLYAKADDSNSNWVPLNENFIKQILQLVDVWREDIDSEKSIAVFGARGSGKTSCLDHLAKKLGSDAVKTKKISVPERTYTPQKLERFLDENFPESEEKSIVLVDNAHNLFLSTINGFDAYRNFLEFMNNKRPHLFWVVAFNEQSWIYLNSVLGNHQYFRKKFRVPKWTDDGIKQLILNLHKTTDYKLKFDQVFNTSSNNENPAMVSSAEQRYFQLLWEQSRGIPGVALELWMKSLQVTGTNQMTVCLPRDNKVSELGKLHSNMFFVYSALVKHDNLRIKEAVLATNLSEGLVRQALLRGLEEGFLNQEKGRYRVTMSWFTDMISFLKGRNLLYEAN